jgi:hypothetical protein
VASLDPCPAVPTPGDTVLAEINLTFSGGGGSEGQLLSSPVNADGSWSGNVTFFFSGVGRKATISAECLDFFGFGAVPYAQYSSHLTMLSG